MTGRKPAGGGGGARDDEVAALERAYEGVVPLGKGPVRAATTSSPSEHHDRAARLAENRQRAREADAAARSRLEALVAGGVYFTVEGDEDGRVFGVRDGADKKALARELRARGVRVDATLDLHGATTSEVDARVVAFLRRAADKGASKVLIVHGKGLHSADGRGVLGEAVVDALTESGAASYVVAFATATTELGGLGATVVRLGRRR